MSVGKPRPHSSDARRRHQRDIRADAPSAEWQRSAVDPCAADRELAITAVNVAEILYGLDLMADGRRKADLRTRFTAVLERAFPDRVLPFDEAAAAAYARIRGDRDRGGRPISVNDAMIAAIARIHGAAVVTRNVTDFAHCAIGVLNPGREADAP